MTNLVIDRVFFRRNLTFTDAPTAQQIDALIRNGYRYDEKAQQWWKIEKGASSYAAANATVGMDWQEQCRRNDLGLEVEITQEQHRERFQSYYTPVHLAVELVQIAGVETGMRCLEPSAGSGAIAGALVGAGAEIRCVEADPDAFLKLEEEVGHTEHADFLELTPERLGLFDRIVMNPPFSRDQDARHVCHAFGFLKPGGKLVAIVGSYALRGNTNDRRKLAGLIQAAGRIVRDVPPGTFDNNARAVIIELNKA